MESRWDSQTEHSASRSACSRAADEDRPRSGNDTDFIPLPMIPLTELVVGYATGRADVSRWNQNHNRFNAME